MNIKSKFNPFELGSLAFGLRRKKLTVFTPCHFSLLVENQITGVQTNPYKLTTL